MTEEPVTPPIHVDNLDELELTNTVLEMRQEGNFLIGTTDKGITFKQHIKPGKLLNKVDGRYVLQDIVQR